jgi:hypothetical protein
MVGMKQVIIITHSNDAKNFFIFFSFHRQGIHALLNQQKKAGGQPAITCEFPF